MTRPEIGKIQIRPSTPNVKAKGRTIKLPTVQISVVTQIQAQQEHLKKALVTTTAEQLTNKILTKEDCKNQANKSSAFTEDLFVSFISTISTKMILQLNPSILVETPLGTGQTIFIIDYGMHQNRSEEHTSELQSQSNL